jgi:DNA primase large subunit
MENAMAFWRREFMKGGKSSDEFDKEYSYNLRHMYGQEGSRAKYCGHSCKVVIASLDSTGQTGCPYRACKTQDLERMLGQMKVSDAAVKSAVALAQEQRYQLACCAVFEELHGKHVEVTAPHQYFEESRKHYKDEQDAETTEKEGDAQM